VDWAKRVVNGYGKCNRNTLRFLKHGTYYAFTTSLRKKNHTTQVQH